MANDIANDNTPYKRLVEQDDTAVPDAEAGGQNLFIDEADQALKLKDSSGVVTEVGGSGGRTLIASETPSGTNTVTFNSIPGTYKSLEIEFVMRGTELATNSVLRLRFNNDTTDGNYRKTNVYGYGSTTVGAGAGDDPILIDVAAANAPTNSPTIGLISIPFYAGTTFNKMALAQHTHRRDNSSVQQVVYQTGMEWESNVAITRVDLVLGSGNFVAGSEIRLYGVP